MLFTQQEINAIASLLARLPMSPAEALFATGFLQRLKAFCTPPPKPEPGPLADALAMADALDKADREAPSAETD